MHKELNQILRLYGEPRIEPEASAEEPGLLEEFETLDSMKRMLDNRSRVAAPENVVRKVLELERFEREPQIRRDRGPVTRGKRRSGPLFVGAGTTLLLLLIASLFVFNIPADELTVPLDLLVAVEMPREQTTGSAPANEVEVPADISVSEPGRLQTRQANEPRTESTRPPAATQLASMPLDSSPRIVSVSSEPADAGLSWDDGRDLRRLHMMIDVMQDRGDETAWEEASVPLELLPSARSSSNRGFQNASHEVPNW